jgi:aminoglycoside phosphotransferase (APT) family kinase protein
MYSLSKIQLSADLAQAVVKKHFGTQRKLKTYEELKEGFFNAAALLELDDGWKFVLKAAPPDEVRVLRYERDIMRAEVESMRLVRQQTEVPVPQIYCFDTSRSVLPSSFFIMECLPGTPFHKLRPGLSPEDQASIERQMGHLARLMSEITGPAFGYWAQPEPPSCTWRECFTHMLQGVIQDGQEMEVKFPLSYEEIYSELESHLSVLDEVKTPCLVHWDLWPGNVFVDPKTMKITGLIDFERVMWADPLIEVFFGYLDPNSSTVQGFGSELFREPGQVRRRLLYNAYLFLIMVIETYYRHFETRDQENWARGMLDKTLQQLSGF